MAPDPKGGKLLVFGGGGAWCPIWGVEHHIKRISKGFESVIVMPSTYDGHFELERTTFFCRDRFQSLENMPDAVFGHDMAFDVGPLDYPKGSGEGYFFRTDRESSGSTDIPRENVDISLKGRQHTPLDGFFKAIARYDVIHTDRLHVGIAGCLMEREVHFRPSSYFKIPAVFRSSIEGRFARVFLHD